MGFESGLVVLWDLRTKVADSRFIASEPLRSVSWLSDGKQLISAHNDGSLYTWNSRAGPRPAPVSITYPHGRSKEKASFPTHHNLMMPYVCVFEFVLPSQRRSRRQTRMQSHPESRVEIIDQRVTKIERNHKSEI